MRFPFSLLAATQVPLQTPDSYPNNSMAVKTEFTWKEGVDIFSPKDLVGLGRPVTGVANPAGDLVLVPFSKYSFEEKKSVFHY